MSRRRQQRSSTRQALLLTAARLTGSALQAAQLIMLARLVTPGQFGVVASVLGAATVVAAAGDLGTSTFVLAERARHPASLLVRTAVRVGGVSAMFVALGAFTVTLVVIPLGAALSLGAIWLWAVADRSADALSNVALADGHTAWATSAAIGRRALSLALFFVLLAAGVDAVLAFSLALAAASVVWWQAATVRMRGAFPSGGTGYRSTLSGALPFWGSNLSGQLRAADVPAVAFVAGSLVAADYAVGVRFGAPLLVAATSIANTLLPQVARSGSELNLLRGKKFLLIVAALVVGVAGGVAAAPWGVPAMLGSSYAAAVVPVQILLPGLVLAGATIALGSVLQGLGDRKFVAWNGILFACALLISIAVSAATFGATGAALAFSAIHGAKMVRLVLRLVRFHRSRKRITHQAEGVEP
jgi:O-antigen/teichoic acid export membrane protein